LIFSVLYLDLKIICKNICTIKKAAVTLQRESNTQTSAEAVTCGTKRETKKAVTRLAYYVGRYSLSLK
jgi:hypothetical protein